MHFYVALGVVVVQAPNLCGAEVSVGWGGAGLWGDS